MINNNRIIIMICTKDRPTELALLLQSIRTQVYNSWDIIISDDNSGTPITNYHFLMCIINKIKEEGHKVYININPFGLGVSKNRQKCVDIAMKEFTENNLLARVDDDILLEPSYLEKLLRVINAGYDLASGLTPPIMIPVMKRDIKFVEPIVNECFLNEKGELILNIDDCGYLYTEEKILPCDHFRSCCLYKKELHDKGVNYSNKLSKHGYREEQIFSWQVILKGFTMGVNTNAIVWHLCTPSGGERFSNSNELIQFNEQMLMETTKELYEKYGDFIQNYHIKLGIGKRSLDMPKFNKENNLGHKELYKK